MGALNGLKILDFSTLLPGPYATMVLADLGADHEDMVELAWALGEALGVEIDESDLNVEMTVGELWRYAMDVAENADM